MARIITIGDVGMGRDPWSRPIANKRRDMRYKVYVENREVSKMAKVETVGDANPTGRYCPQCRKRVPDANIREKGIVCSRCGFFKWEEFDNYPPFADIPRPDAPVPGEEVAEDSVAKYLQERLKDDEPEPEEPKKAPVKKTAKKTSVSKKSSTTKKSMSMFMEDDDKKDDDEMEDGGPDDEGSVSS